MLVRKADSEQVREMDLRLPLHPVCDQSRNRWMDQVTDAMMRIRFALPDGKIVYAMVINRAHQPPAAHIPEIVGEIFIMTNVIILRCNVFPA